MPVVDPGSEVLVTGANGYISMWDGAFDEAVKGVDGIAHMSSPLNPLSDDPDDYIKPAVSGALRAGCVEIFDFLYLSTEAEIFYGSAVSEHKSNVSSSPHPFAVVSAVTGPPRTFDESDWGNEYVKGVKEQGKKSSADLKYRASKTWPRKVYHSTWIGRVSHRLFPSAAWDFYDKHKTQISWDLVTLNPAFICGLPLQEEKMPADLNFSLEIWGVAAVLVASLSDEVAAGEGIILFPGTTTWQDLRDVIYSLKPD
ncbi:hypothetical protein BDZ97DRAFT_1929565 [Flammula alnicola]|nr:hypothetical protein BDZ97DRAFT_1929565 [Flammula alnicola]